MLSPEDINVKFQSINTDQRYVTPEPIQIPEVCRVPTVDEHSVRNLLVHQKRTLTAPGLDELAYWLRRDYASHLAPIITKIFNSSLKHHTVPSMWKRANVSPILKESPLNDCNQLRSISLTNIIMRIFERVVCKQES